MRKVKIIRSLKRKNSSIDSALTSKNLNNFKKIDSDTYESNNYHDVDKIVNIDIDIGVSSLTIDWY